MGEKCHHGWHSDNGYDETEGREILRYRVKEENENSIKRSKTHRQTFRTTSLQEIVIAPQKSVKPNSHEKEKFERFSSSGAPGGL